MAYRAEVIADESGRFLPNGLVFGTRKEAEDYASDLSRRWLAVRDWRVIETDEAVNCTYVSGRTVFIKE